MADNRPIPKPVISSPHSKEELLQNFLEQIEKIEKEEGENIYQHYFIHMKNDFNNLNLPLDANDKIILEAIEEMIGMYDKVRRHVEEQKNENLETECYEILFKVKQTVISQLSNLRDQKSYSYLIQTGMHSAETKNDVDQSSDVAGGSPTPTKGGGKL